MLVDRESKIATLENIQEDLLQTYKVAKSTETRVDGENRLKIERAKDEIERLHKSVGRLIQYYKTAAH